MKEKIDLDNWKRKDLFNFFNAFDEPFYGVCVDIDCTKAYRLAKTNQVSFYLYCVYQSLTASHIIEPFRLRVEHNEVYRYDRIDAGSTISKPDGTFGFGDFIYDADFERFHTAATAVIKRVQVSRELQRSEALNVIRFSALPWIKFTSVSHARMFSFKDSCPKISFGKLTETDGKRMMPVSIHVNHALVDGLNVGEFIDCLQTQLNSDF